MRILEKKVMLKLKGGEDMLRCNHPHFPHQALCCEAAAVFPTSDADGSKSNRSTGVHCTQTNTHRIYTGVAYSENDLNLNENSLVMPKKKGFKKNKKKCAQLFSQKYSTRLSIVFKCEDKECTALLKTN